MTSSRIPVLAGALMACLVVGGCSFTGGAQAPVTSPSSASTPRATTPDASPTTAPPASAAPTGTGAGGTTSGGGGTSSSTATPRAPAGAPTSPPPGKTSASLPPGAPAGTAGADDADPDRCATADLAVSIGASGGGAAGSVYTAVVLQNTGATACTLSGYPGVSHVAGADGHQVGAAASRDGASAEARVTLQPGDVAHSTLRIVQYRAYSTQECQPEAVDGYRVYPPGSKAAAFVAQSGTTCSAPGAGVLSVQAVQPGPPAR